MIREHSSCVTGVTKIVAGLKVTDAIGSKSTIGWRITTACGSSSATHGLGE